MDSESQKTNSISEIFKFLFDICDKSKDKEGVAAACLVRDGKIIISSPSADDSIMHAEDLVVEQMKKQGIVALGSDILFTTKEPCSKRSPGRNVTDCTTSIINAGIKHVVFAAPDSCQTVETQRRLKEANVSIKQVEDRGIIEKAKQAFNSTQLNPDKRKL